jgi:hypothetical protein
MTKPLLSKRDLAWRLRIARTQLEALARNIGSHYTPFIIEQAGKKPRRIDNPDKELKRVQKRINQILLRAVEMPQHLHGGVLQRSTRTNSSSHLATPTRCLAARRPALPRHPPTRPRPTRSRLCDI